MICKNKSLNFITVILIAGLLLIARCLSASAQAPDQPGVTVINVTQQDLDKDGRPDLTIIDCAFATSHDRILVYDQGGDMRWGSTVAQTTDFDNDAWIFDVGADGTAQLIVKFQTDHSNKIAYVYDALGANKDGSYEYTSEKKLDVVDFTAGIGPAPNTKKEKNWHLKVVANQSWVQPDGSENPNLHIFIDGSVLHFLESGEVSPDYNWGQIKLTTDGSVDWEIEIVDANQDGVPDYQLESLLKEAPALSPVFQTTLYVNKDTLRPQNYPGSLFWPLLVSKHAYEDYNYFSRPAVVAVDWQKAQIDRVGILGYPTENGYHINSRAYLQKGKTNYLSFENPMAYYDLAGDHDGQPELFVGMNVFNPNDPFFPNNASMGKIDVPFVQVDTSWDQNNDGKWDYKVALGAQRSIDSVVDFPDFSILSVPYVSIPSWVQDHNWDAALFVAAENGGEKNAEGMAQWSLNRGYLAHKDLEPSSLRDQFLVGLTPKPPVEEYQDIRAGYRGEYNFEYFNHPGLYLSSIDLKLHLLGAQSGVWNLNDQEYIRYSNLGQKETFDQWQYLKNGQVIKQVNVSANIVLFSTEDSLQIKQTSASPLVFQTVPPKTNADWKDLGSQLKPFENKIDPVDFQSMFSQLQGKAVSLQNVRMDNYRLTSAGFSFELELKPGYKIIGGDWINLAGTPPGKYFVTYDESFHFKPLTDPAIQFSGQIQLPGNVPVITFNQQQVSISVANLGLANAAQVKVDFGFSLPGGVIEWADPQVVTIPGGQELSVNFPWAPVNSGKWNLLVTAGLTGVEGAASSTVQISQQIDVKEAQQTTFQQEISAFGVVEPWQVAAMLVAMILAAGLMAWAFMQAASDRLK